MIKKSFTIFELVMVIAIVGILVGIGGPLTVKLFESFQYVVYRKELSETADLAINRLSRELRRLKNATSVFTANNTSYRFLDYDNRSLGYNLNGTRLEREINGTTDILAVGIEQFSFDYLDDSLTPIAYPQVSPNPTDIKFIRFSFEIATDTNSIFYQRMIKLLNVIHVKDLFE
ncbi:MAG: hypothetical protein PHV17_06645 [Candidatus Omnitrophica bacterium]|nr:hypothetical protein [Candidatus Omnitrophota bacterium]